MKSRDTLIRLKRFQVDDKRRRVAQIEMMIAEFDRMAADLNREIAAEEHKAGISDPNHFAYPTYARAAAARRDNLLQSIGNLHTQLDDAKAELGEAFEDLKRAESLEDRERSVERTLEQAAIGQMGHSRALRATA
ncbi:flagellar export protein FliJ [Microvirga terricola]|uniref:Flagellar export protein FliJ n=1 Tax=Microvirga terricola TaxID=2719797 RepID=A0ABX0V9D2_9HYPH|nr:flagellar export protein FliJ [Microvirga terricola]NIX76158.1 flagellar export protein FliJ [Microvirga terricola]